MAVKRVIFIRPGETDWNRLGRWQGWVAVPLSEHGRQQARQLSLYIRNIGMSALYTSDLKRAVETAEILAQQSGSPPILDSRLRERKIGAWQGLTLDEIRDWYADDYARLLADPDGFIIPGGESRREVRQRAVQAFDNILLQNKGETVGIISHTTAIHALLTDLVPDCRANEIVVSNMSVTTIALDDSGQWRLVAIDEIHHLEGLETRAYPELEDRR